MFSENLLGNVLRKDIGGILGTRNLLDRQHSGLDQILDEQVSELDMAGLSACSKSGSQGLSG